MKKPKTKLNRIKPILSTYQPSHQLEAQKVHFCNVILPFDLVVVVLVVAACFNPVQNGIAFSSSRIGSFEFVWEEIDVASPNFLFWISFPCEPIFSFFPNSNLYKTKDQRSDL